MKSKLIITLTALLMLGGISAMAQGSFPKGDINEDGVVNAADVVALVNIIMNGGGSSGETNYYWYAGTTIPTAENISTIATGSETSKPDWSEPQSIKATNNIGESAYLYYCFPTDWNIKVLDSDKTTEMSLAQEGTFTYGGISYTVQRTGRQISNGNSKDYYATTTSGEAKYYWYAGPDMLTSETVPGINVENECSYGWHVITGNPTSIETGELGTSDCPKINWVLAVPTKFGLTRISNGEDVTDAYEVSTVTTADGVEYIVFKQTSATKKTDRTFVKGSSNEAKYYWYAGTTLPTADNIASIALGSSNTIEQWDGKEFSITNSGEEATPAYVCTPVDFKVSWKDMNGFTLNLVEVEGAGFTLNGVEYIVQKRGRDLSAGATFTVRGYYTDSGE